MRTTGTLIGVLVASVLPVATASAEPSSLLGTAPPSARGTLVRLELVAESARTHISSAWVNHPEGAVVLARDGDANIRGAAGRVLFGSSRVFVGLELGVGDVTSAPSFRDGSQYRSIAPLPPSLASSGYSVTLASPIGVQGRAGRILAGVEGLVGWRRIVLESATFKGQVDGFVPLFEARARAGVWLTPTVSLSAIAGMGVVVNESRSLCLVLSVSRTPWDGALE